MTFTAKYKDADHKFVERSDMLGASIPAFAGNRDYEGIADAGVTIAKYATPAKTPPDVNVERDRRIAAGTTFTVTGYGRISSTGTHADKDVFLARRMLAKEAEAAGVTASVFLFRDANNVIHNLTPAQMIELADKGISWIEAMMVRSWAMKDGVAPYVGGIPADLENDRHWPRPGDQRESQNIGKTT